WSESKNLQQEGLKKLKHFRSEIPPGTLQHCVREGK
ncbi:hypothetical protein CEXT_289651, partial [Caerostris extrusa]